MAALCYELADSMGTNAPALFGLQEEYPYLIVLSQVDVTRPLPVISDDTPDFIRVGVDEGTVALVVGHLLMRDSCIGRPGF